jgi:hypothetical protein
VVAGSKLDSEAPDLEFCRGCLDFLLCNAEILTLRFCDPTLCSLVGSDVAVIPLPPSVLFLKM